MYNMYISVIAIKLYSEMQMGKMKFFSELHSSWKLYTHTHQFLILLKV